MKTVSHYEFCEELARCRAKLNEMGANRRIELYEIRFRDTIQIGVNWSAIGTVDHNQTREFADLLMVAADLASNFKYNGYKIVYGD